ncbi:competence/damage-inducible protein A [Bacillus taeanensis]|uniref:Putative competence-damage inducible protein n=1 Tax=Bacillus taeanensis TaxID=273032 RepID=A0A366XUV3_9BACI|nr:competence/damage-inducible protein A [Bacillus taeanensis]RBW69912.1 competence/damage-inducible protein A [Bacillus taeanensis]
MNAEIIAIGSELLLGQICNSNAQFLSKQLAELGVNVYYHTVVGDNAERLQHTINVAKDRSNLIIFTGGLGPTKDDLTKETVASFLKKELVYNQKAMDQITAYFERTNRIMTPNNKKQALVLKGSAVLANDFGMAPGMAVKENNTIYMMFPGPPKELKPMFLKYGKQFLQQEGIVKDQIVSRVLRFFGIGESQLETDIEDIIDTQTNPTIAPLAADGEVTLRITAKHKNKQEAEEMLDQLEETIYQRIGQYFYGYEETSLRDEVFRLLQEQQKTIACAESLTGGMFAQTITDLPGASDVFKGGVSCYTKEMKEQLVHVPHELLETEGAISAACAESLAVNIKKITNAHIGISFTGVAGPSKSEGQEPGTVYIGIASGNNQEYVHKLQLAGSREGIRKRTIQYGYSLLLKHLKKGE